MRPMEWGVVCLCGCYWTPTGDGDRCPRCKLAVHTQPPLSATERERVDEIFDAAEDDDAWS